MSNPFVPDVLGVPQLLRDVTPAQPVLLMFDGIDSLGPSEAPQWGIFKDGNPIVMADTILDFGYRQDWLLSDYPVEDGGFQTYNKVSTPFDVRVRFAMGGTDADRAALLGSLDTIAGNLELYDAVMPERIYQDVNVMHYDFQRRYDDGVGLLKVDVWMLEVRKNAKATFSTVDGPPLTGTKNPTADSMIDSGMVQSQEPTLPEADRITRELRGE